MFCEHCGAPINPGEQFCGRCGGKVSGLPNQAGETNEKTVSIARGEADLNKTESVHTARPKAENKIPPDVLQAAEEVGKIWPDWEIVGKLGEGSFGKVFRAKRTELGTDFFSAIKVIRIPQNKEETETVRSEIGLDEQSTTSYYKGFVDECVNEIKLMESLKGTQNIVSVEDYKVVPHEGEIGWTIFIRMELLTGFTAYTKNKTLSEEEVIKLGIDICNALEFCGKLNVMHRDIKPENIFVSSFGIYKLGDFGIARKLERATVGLSKKGTYNYMAPEIYNGSTSYDFTSDIYSLGIVLYKLLNNNRLPLLDPNAGNITYQQMQAAFEQRMQGAALPNPCNASPALSAVILTACAYDPSMRFPNAAAFKAALTRVMNGETDLNAILDGTVSVRNAPKAAVRQQAPAMPQNAAPAKAAPVKQEKPAKPPKKKMKKGKKILIGVTAAILVLAIAAGALYLKHYFSPEQKMLRALEEDNYDAALEIFNEDLNGEGGEALTDALTERLNTVKADFENGTKDYVATMAELDDVESMHVREVSTLLNETRDFVICLNDSRTAFSTAESMMQSGNYEGALAQYKLVQDIDDNYTTAMAQMEVAANGYRDAVLGTADTYASNGLYEDAIDQLNIGLAVLPEDAKLVEQIRIYQDAWAAQNKAELLQKAADYVTAGDYPGAIKLLAGNDDDAEINTAYKKYCNAYEEQVLADADAMIVEKNFDGAISLLNSGLKVLKNNENFTAMLKEAEASKPVSVRELSVLNSNRGWDTQVTKIEDALGYSYYDAANAFVPYQDGYGEYYINGKYAKVTGRLSSYYNMEDGRECHLQIFVDDNSLYISPPITQKTESFTFEVDIPEGAKYIKFVCNANGYSNSDILITDLLLWP